MLNEANVNGLRVLWTDGPEPYTAALIVGVGASDETLRTDGVNHLVEHLVMAAQPRTVLDVNASVDDVTTIFHATGPREEVAAWLGRVCATIRQLPVDRLAVEARVLAAEDGSVAPPALGWAATVRYGTEGPGMLGVTGAPYETLTADHVRHVVEQYYTSDNAVLVATGTPPEHPDLGLPAGVRPPRVTAIPTEQEIPAYLARTPEPVASWVLPRGATSVVLSGLLKDRLTESLRHDEGLVYEIGDATARLDRERALTALWSDGASEDQQRILLRLVETLRAIVEVGPDEAELAHQKAVARAQMTDPRGTLEYLVFSADRLLEDRPVLSIEDAVAEVEAVSPTDLSEAAAEALRTLLLGGSDPAPEGIGGIPDRTEDEPAQAPDLSGRTWRRRVLSTAPLDLRLVVGDEGIVQKAQGLRHGGRWEHVRGVGKGPDFRAVVFRDGSQVVVWPGSLSGGNEAVAEIDRRAGELLFEVTTDWL